MGFVSYDFHKNYMIDSDIDYVFFFYPSTAYIFNVVVSAYGNNPLLNNLFQEKNDFLAITH